MAAGDTLIDADGNMILDADGNTMIHDGVTDGCCCDEECVCPELAESITIDLTGTWAGGGPCWLGFPCTPILTTIELPNNSGESSCEFGIGGLTPGEKCVGGYSISNIQLSLGGDCFWQLVIEFHDPDGVGGVTLVLYRQRTPTRTDPTGVYDIYDDGGCPGGFPSSVTAL